MPPPLVGPYFIGGRPAAVYFSAMYAESVAVALTVATFYHARRAQWVRAGVAGALAAATHDTGIVLTAVVGLEALRHAGDRISWRPCSLRSVIRAGRRTLIAARPGFAAATLVPVGLLSYLVYLAHTFGDPFVFLHSEARWGRTISPFSVLHILPQSVNTGYVCDLLATVIAIPIIIGVVRQGDAAATTYTVVAFLLPLSTGAGAYGMTRLTLGLVPCFVLLGYWGRNVWVHRLIMAVSIPAMIYIAVLFSHWAGPT